MDKGTKKLLHEHSQSVIAFSRSRHGGAKPCECGDELEPYWNFCPQCGKAAESK